MEEEEEEGRGRRRRKRRRRKRRRRRRRRRRKRRRGRGKEEKEGQHFGRLVTSWFGTFNALSRVVGHEALQNEWYVVKFIVFEREFLIRHIACPWYPDIESTDSTTIVLRVFPLKFGKVLPHNLTGVVQ